MILAALGMLFSCQRAELPAEELSTLPESEITGEATIRFSAMLPLDPDTKAMGDAPIDGDNSDIKNMFLVIFDENGMLVEHREATNIALHSHDGHNYEASYDVTLTITDQPRIIHFIANCPVEQITYGHETSIIGNMYVEKDQDSGTPETAYWARIEVSDLIVAGAGTDNPYFETESVAQAFKCVPMLRNFAQINVKNVDQIQVPEGHTFVFEGFTVYNTVDMGTVAPYNKGIGAFQSFINPETNARYKYPDFLEMQPPYEGHALAAAELNQSLEIANPSSTNDETKYKWYGPEDSFYMYERKISVKTADESKWNESPPHVIIKGKYDGQTCYYKVDLVYDVVENDKVSEIVYYNILRNFKYQFTLTKVANKGYPSVDEAVKGATSNNLAGSATTSNFTNISDNQGRMWVSYTDKVLVTNDDITLYYRYEPDLGSGEYNNNLKDIDGGVIQIVDLDGVEIEGSNVIKKITVADNDETTGEWAGYRRIDIKVNDPQAKSKEQTIVIKSDQATLARRVHYTLRQKFTLDVACTPKIEAVIGEPVQVDIILPGGLTESMFPLNLMVEVADMTLSPNADKNTIPVEIGPSTIPDKNGKPAFYYVVTISHKDEYNKLPSLGTNKVVSTYWLSNIANSASTVYVTNPYFNPDSAPFGNGMKFLDVKINDDKLINTSQLFYGAGESVAISFTKSSYDNNFTNRNITVKLNGLADANGNTTLTVKPTGNTHTIQNLVTTTLDGSVSFTVEENDYITTESQTVSRYQGEFTDLKLGGVSSGEDIPKGADYKTSISFKLDSFDPRPKSRQVKVDFDGLIDANGQTSQTITPSGSEVVIENLYTLTSAGNISFTVTEVNGVYEDAVAQFGRIDMRFTNLTLPQNIRQGENRKVNISFQMSESDADFASREVTVKLYGLKDPADNDDEIKVYPTADNRTVTIKDLLTSSINGEIYYTVSADGYEPDESNHVTNRTRGTFTIQNTGFSKQSLGADEEVEFSFTLSDYEEDMVIDVALDGLIPADGTLEGPVTKAVSHYRYKPTGENCVLKLKTTSTEQNATCSVQLFAEDFYYDESAKKTINQVNLVTYKGSLNVTIKNLSIQHYKNNQDPTPGIQIQEISVSGATVNFNSNVTDITKTTRYSGRKYTLTQVSFNINNLEITGSGLKDDTEISIKVKITYGNSAENTVTYKLSNIK